MPFAANDLPQISYDPDKAKFHLKQAGLDPTKLAEIYHEAQHLLAEEGGTVVPMFASFVYARKDTLANGELAKNWSLDGQKFAERWWYA